MFNTRYNRGNTFTKPENALRNANDLRATGDLADLKHAVYILHGTVMSRKFRAYIHEGTLQENVMQLYCELAYDVGDLKTLREGLYSYRGMTQVSSNEAFIDTLSGLLDYAEANLSNAVRDNGDNTQELTDDLEDEYRPESLMYSCLELGSKPQARAVVDHLKRVWAIYKLVLDLLKSLPKYESFYHGTAQRALKFCVEHNRPQEFRRLVEILKYQYMSISKLKLKNDSAQRPERHFATRIVQLQGTSKLKLWRLALDTVEDLVELGFHDYPNIRFGDNKDVERSLEANAIANHYSLIATHLEQCSLIFWETKDYLYHSLALVKLLLHNRKKASYAGSDEEQRLANQVILSIASVPKNHVALKGESPAKNIAYDRKLRSILGHASQVSYDNLVDQIFRRGIHLAASQPVVNLLNLVNKGFDDNSLSIVNQLQDVLTIVKAECAGIDKIESYLDLIYTAAITKVILTASKVFDSILISKLQRELLNDADPTKVEDVLLDIGAESNVNVVINSGDGYLYFKQNSGNESGTNEKIGSCAVALKTATKQLKKSHPTRAQVFSNIRQREQELAEYTEKRQIVAAKLLDDLNDQSDKLLSQQQERDNERINALREMDSYRISHVRDRERKQALTAQLQEQNLSLATKILAEIEREADGLPVTINGTSIKDIKAKDIATGKYTFSVVSAAIKAARHKEIARIKNIRSQEMKTVDYYTRAVRENSRDSFKQLQAEFQRHVYEMWKESMLDTHPKGHDLVKIEAMNVRKYAAAIAEVGETIPRIFRAEFNVQWQAYKNELNKKIRQQNLKNAITRYHTVAREARII